MVQPMIEARLINDFLGDIKQQKAPRSKPECFL